MFRYPTLSLLGLALALFPSSGQAGHCNPKCTDPKPFCVNHTHCEAFKPDLFTPENIVTIEIQGKEFLVKPLENDHPAAEAPKR